MNPPVRVRNNPLHFHTGLNTENARLDGYRILCYEQYDHFHYNAILNVGPGFTVTTSYYLFGSIMVHGYQTYRGRSHRYEISVALPHPGFRHNLVTRINGENIFVSCSQLAA